MSISSGKADFRELFSSTPVCTVEGSFENCHTIGVFSDSHHYQITAWRPIRRPHGTPERWGAFPDVALRAKPQSNEEFACTWLGRVYKPYQVAGFPKQNNAQPLAEFGDDVDAGLAQHLSY